MQNLNQFQDEFEQFLFKSLPTRSPDSLYAPIRYIISLGGKRLRPISLLIFHQLFGGKNLHGAFQAGAAVEVFHNFTLVHDDIMDTAPIRRGQPTVHHKYGVNSGILSGDAMLVLAYEYLLNSDTHKLTDLFRIFNKTALEVCEGQQLDMEFETRPDVQLDEYLKMIELKTAVLLAAAMQMGAILGGASTADAALVYEFGKNLGIAFQVQDDLLDAYGDPKKFGKKPGGDIIQNKKTYLFLKALEICNESQRSTLRHLYSSADFDPDEKVKEVLHVFDAVGIRQLTGEAKQAFFDEALKQIEATSLPKESLELLRTFSKGIMEREF